MWRVRLVQRVRDGVVRCGAWRVCVRACVRACVLSLSLFISLSLSHARARSLSLSDYSLPVGLDRRKRRES